MIRNSNFVRKNWRWSMIALKFALAMFVLAIGLSVFEDVKRGKSFDWTLAIYGLGFLIFSGLLYLVMRLIHKLVLAKSLHDERYS